MKRKAIVWFRQDLRVHDNEALFEAINCDDELLAVYVFDDKFFKNNTQKFGFRKTGIHRTQFIIQAVEALREKLKIHGIDLIVRCGKTEDVIFELAKSYKSNWVYCNRESTYDEVQIQDQLELKLWSIGQELRFTRGKMLYYTQDLPFPITHTPDNFANFKKEVEKIVPIRVPLMLEEDFTIPCHHQFDLGEVPKLSDFGWSNEKIFQYIDDDQIIGGEDEGLKQLDVYLDYEKKKSLSNLKSSSCNDIKTSKLSAYISQGCISPKLIYQKLKSFEVSFGKSEAIQTFIQLLMRRDFYRLIAKKHRNRIFHINGLKKNNKSNFKDDIFLFESWKNGKTGTPFIDAIMNELAYTGYISNFDRNIVANYLVNELNINWQMGAEYFESVLIDYDVSSNWCNWNYIAGVGCESKDEKFKNVMCQSKKRDPDAKYIKKWLPQLNALPNDFLHQLDEIEEVELKKYNFSIPKNYFKPLVSRKKVFKKNDKLAK